MLKKLLIAAVAVIAGLLVVRSTHSGHQVIEKIWHGITQFCCHAKEEFVTPEDQLRQLRADIKNIDRDIESNKSKLARMKVELDEFEERLNGKRVEETKLRAQMDEMDKSFDDQTRKVVSQGRHLDANALKRRLQIANTRYKGLTGGIMAQEQVLKARKRIFESGLNYIAEMKVKQEELVQVADDLESYLMTLKFKQMENQVVGCDENAVTRAFQNAKNIKSRLRTQEEKMKLDLQFGDDSKVQWDTEDRKSLEEVRNDTKALLTAKKFPTEKNEE